MAAKITKQKTSWSCQECGHSQTKWAGQCLQCGQWNSFREELEIEVAQPRFGPVLESEQRPKRLTEVVEDELPRSYTGMQEFDRLLGGGIVPGALVLVGGDPGIGKSTLLLQASQAIAAQGKTVLYVCGEESVGQTSLRAKRIGADSANLFLLNETNFAAIKKQVSQLQPAVVIVDSIQMMYKSEIPSAPGSVSQVREIATEFMHLCKMTGMAAFVIGHVTKSGDIAGPRVLEHIVDTVLYFEGDRQQNYRLMRVVKNRFGPTDEIAVFKMATQGLKQVENPSELFLEERMRNSSGSVIISTVEGSRPILVEVQALVSDTAYPTPSRRCTGIDQNRLALLLAVLEKRVKYQLHSCDVFVSLAGGIRIVEPAIDLGVLLAVASSFCNTIIDPHTIVVGEVGLGGEVRTVPRVETRIKEAIHMGFQTCVLPKRNLKGLPEELARQIRLEGVELVEEAIHAAVR